MKVYRLSIEPGESDSEGEDHDEWFTSFHAALVRRRELIAENPYLENHRTGVDFGIYQFELAKLPPMKLAMALLNRNNLVYPTSAFERSEQVVAEYYPPAKPEVDDGDA